MKPINMKAEEVEVSGSVKVDKYKFTTLKMMKFEIYRAERGNHSRVKLTICCEFDEDIEEEETDVHNLTPLTTTRV